MLRSRRSTFAGTARALVWTALAACGCSHAWDDFDPRLAGAASSSAATGTGGAAGSGGTGGCASGETRPCYSGPAATAKVGECHDGTQTCDGSGWGPCTGEKLPTTETCDGKDEDCNGTIDDGTGGGGTVEACGMCGEPCATGPNATPVCEAGACKLVCTPGYADCDADPATGCEADLTAVPNCGACGRACAGGTCGTSLVASMTASPPGWSFNGNAVWDSTSKSAVLTDVAFSQVGTLAYATPIVTDSFTLNFEFAIGGGTGADGLAFGIHENGATAVGMYGGGLGLAGLTGYAIELDTYNNGECGDVAFPHAGIDALTSCGTDGTPTSVAVSGMLPIDILDAAWHACSVTFDQGTITVSLDGMAVVGPTALPGFVSGKQYSYAFGAGTGGTTNRHEVRNVTLTFPTPRCL